MSVEPPIQAKSKSSYVAHKKTYSSSSADPKGSIHVLEDATGEGWQEFVGAV